MRCQHTLSALLTLMCLCSHPILSNHGEIVAEIGDSLHRPFEIALKIVRVLNKNLFCSVGITQDLIVRQRARDGHLHVSKNLEFE